MDAGIIGVFIPIIALMIPIVAIWTKHQQKLAEMNIRTTAQATAEQAAQYASKMQQIDDRVQVLERIITDRGYDVATQIEALRDQRRVDESAAGVALDTSSKDRV